MASKPEFLDVQDSPHTLSPSRVLLLSVDEAQLDVLDEACHDSQRCGHIPVIDFLLSRGADMTARDNNGDTALGGAAYNDKLPACKYLISRGSDLMAKNNKGETALDIYGTASSLCLLNLSMRLLTTKHPGKEEVLFVTLLVVSSRDPSWTRTEGRWREPLRYD